MEALEFLKEQKRMCKSYKSCYNCPLSNNHCIVNHLASNDDCEKIVNGVEQWSKENPHKTRQIVFLEQFPEATIDEDGVIEICSAYISGDYRNEDGVCANPGQACADCRHGFWSQEVE